jgi:hypothetical protein
VALGRRIAKATAVNALQSAGPNDSQAIEMRV